MTSILLILLIYSMDYLTSPTHNAVLSKSNQADRNRGGENGNLSAEKSIVALFLIVSGRMPTETTIN